MSKPPVVPCDILYLIVTHANCYDGAACAAVLELYCKAMGFPFKTVPHNLWRPYSAEIAEYLVPGVPARSVRLLLFDVAPDTELVDAVLQQPHLSLVVGDHHEGNRAGVTQMIERANLTDDGPDRLTVMFDTTVAGVQLAWRWVCAQFGFAAGAGSGDVGRLLGVPQDTEDGMGNRVLNVIAAADLNAHTGMPDSVCVDAAIRMLHTPDVHSIKHLVCSRGMFDSLLQPGALCVRIRGQQARDLLARGRTYFLIPTIVEMLNEAGAELPETCAVFYVQGTPHLTAEMAERCTKADMVWVWSKNERADKKKYVVSVRRGKPSRIRCDIIASTLSSGGNGHAAASGMAFEREPIDIFVA